MMDGLFGGNAGASWLAQLLSAFSPQSGTAGYNGPQEPLTPFANSPTGAYGAPHEPLTPFANPTTPSSGPTPGAPQSLTPGHPTSPGPNMFATPPYYLSAGNDGYTNSGVLVSGMPGGMMWQSPFSMAGGQSPFSFQSPFGNGAAQHPFAFQSPFVNRNAMNGMHNNAVMAMLRGF